MPMMGNTMETGLLAEWVPDEGDGVEEDEVIAVVESEKAAANVIASLEGDLARIDVEEGEEVPPGTLIGVVLGPEENLDDAPEPRSRIEPGQGEGAINQEQEQDAEPVGEGQTSGAETGQRTESEEGIRAAPGARKLADEHGVDLTGIDGTGPEGAVLRVDVEERSEQVESAGDEQSERPEVSDGRVFASPSSRRLAKELGVSIDQVNGTGTGGRVTESDIRVAASEQGQQQSAARERPPAPSGQEAELEMSDAEALGVTIHEEQPLSGMRRTIAERMSQSAQQVPHVTLNREVAVERAFQTAEELTKEGDTSVGFTDVLIAATVRALDRYSRFNAWFEGERVRLVSERNVAIAVDTEAGLVTPVIREAGTRTLPDIATRRRELTDTVLDGKYSMDDLQGGTFTISNLGMFGVDSFDPIVKPPQVAILAVGRVCDEGERTCTLSLSFDHRVVDGADAARFLDALTAGLEAPAAVVAERAGVQAEERDQAGPSSGPMEQDAESMDELVRQDIGDRALEIAAVHDWPTPTYDVQLDSGRPSIKVRAPNAASVANVKRLTYAACRESRFADTIARRR
jgi:pyruvate dehydrogenase E2 component (dihydrolipoamide acetyltransferase)